MLTKLKKNNEKGFTIIEVMIVLAIAGLILLIVFLAVPALQRNSRNTQRKNDVAGILASVSEYSNNNNGSLPTTCSGTNPITVGVAPGTTSQAKVGYFNLGCAAGNPPAGVSQVGVAALAAGSTAGPYNTAAQDYVQVLTKAQCDTTTPGKAISGSARQIAAIYEIENGAGTYAGACQES